MPFNGSGVWTPSAADFPAIPGTLILSTKFNNNINDIATGLSNCVTRDGQSAATANLPMGGFKHVNVADGTSRSAPTAHYASLGQLQDSYGQWGGTAGGTADALTISINPTPPAYVVGQTFRFKSGAAANATASPTIDINALGPKALQTSGAALPIGYLGANSWWSITYDGAAFQVSSLSIVGSVAASKVVNVRSTGNFTLTVADAFQQQIITATGTGTLPASATLAVGDQFSFKSTSTGDVQIAPAGADTLDGLNAAYRLPAFCSCIVMKTAAATFVILDRPTVNIGDWLWAGYGTANSGYVKAGTAAISRTTYAGLFGVYGSAWGAGNGTTTFGVPDAKGRMPVQAGAGSQTEAVTASSGNGFTVASNTDKWGHCDPIVLSNLTGFTTSATAGPTYYIVRISATNVRLATTLALAQAATPDVTISGSGTATLTTTLTTRTLGEYGGHENKAMTATELLLTTVTGGSHSHQLPYNVANVGGANKLVTPGTNSATPENTVASGSLTMNPFGGNAAMAVENPFLVGELYIKV